jgi:hypothetical protein
MGQTFAMKFRSLILALIVVALLMLLNAGPALADACGTMGKYCGGDGGTNPGVCDIATKFGCDLQSLDGGS